MTGGAVEIISGRERRRRWNAAEKLRIVGETQEPGACIRAVAARHDVYPSLLHYWRRQVREGRLGAGETPRFVPVRLTEPPASAPDAPAAANQPLAAGAIEIVFPDGCRLMVGNDVNLAALRCVVTALRG